MKTLSRTGIQRMTGSGGTTVAGGSGSGSSGGGGGTADYASEAGHALEADHALNADNASEATHATTADASALAAHATSADTAITATNANHATAAANLDANSSDWNKIARKDSSQTIAEVWTFVKGIIAQAKSYFRAGIEVAGGIIADTLGISGNATVGGTLGVTGKLTGKTAELQNLTVTKEMHVFKLTVDDLTSNKGAIIVTSANCTAEDVEEVTPGYTIYWENKDRDGNPVSNPWKVGDLALCLTYKGEGSGTFANVVNRYYWRKVIDVQSNVRHGGDDKWYNTITLSNAQGEYEGTTVPAVGDNIVQLGYNGQTADAARQTAVILSAYPTMDTGVTPPSLAFYKGINDFNLSSHRYTFIDGLNNEFMGNFKILVDGNYKNLTTVLATLEGLALSVRSIVRSKNILRTDGWTTQYGDLIGSTNYNETTQEFTNADGSGGYDDLLWSPIFFLKAGTYTYSHYCNDGDVELYVYGSTSMFTVDEVPPNSLVDIPVNNIRSGDTYHQAQRRYVTFTLNEDSYVCLNIYLSDYVFTMYRPMLEEGSVCSAWETGPVEHTNQIKILSDAINIGIRAGLMTTGINITTGKVAVEADNFTVGKNGVQVFGVDANTGVTTMQDVDIKGSLVYHKTLIDRSNNYYQLFEMYDENGNVVGLDYSGTVHKTVLKYDTIVIGGAERTASYNLFSGVVEYGYTIILPPAKLFKGMRIKIINGTVNSLSVQPAQQKLSKINFAVVYRSDTDTYDEESGTGYAMNNVASVTPVSFEMNNSQGVGTFVGAPQGNTFIRDYTPSTAEHFTCYGLSGDNGQSNPVRYKSFELVSQANPYTSSGYAWTIIELNQ